MKHGNWIIQNITCGSGWGRGYNHYTIDRRTRETREFLSRLFHGLGRRFD